MWLTAQSDMRQKTSFGPFVHFRHLSREQHAFRRPTLQSMVIRQGRHKHNNENHNKDNNIPTPTSQGSTNEGRPKVNSVNASSGYSKSFCPFQMKAMNNNKKPNPTTQLSTFQNIFGSWTTSTHQFKTTRYKPCLRYE